MPRFFTTNINGSRALIESDDARHITKSLRMHVGDSITLCDAAGLDYYGEISAISPDIVEVNILQTLPSPGEPKAKITLYQALPKSDKLEFIVQKAVELGVSEIVPTLTSRCVSRPDEKSMAKKIERLNRTALEAAKQSGRGIIPVVSHLMEFTYAINSMKHTPLPILCYEDASVPLREALGLDSPRIALMIGPEGGFSEDEVNTAQVAGVHIVSLGTRILRCETAPICALAAVMYAFGEF